MTSRSLVLMMLAAALVASCGQKSQTAQRYQSTTTVPAKDIAWFNGSVDQAMAAAARDDKLLFIYWGAKWCPYCQALRKTVFTQPDFIEKTTLFVPVYLDADLPGAQVWGEIFKVSGYPTLLILKPDRTELARLSGGMDLSQYATVLDEALEDQRPILEVLRTVSNLGDCHRLSYYDWDPEAWQGMDASHLANELIAAAGSCQGPDRIRLEIVVLNLSLQAKSDPTQLAPRVQALSALLGRPHDVRSALDLLVGLDDSLFAVVREQGAAVAADFQTRWVQTMQMAADDTQFGMADRLLAFGSALNATRELSPDHAIPLSMQQAAVGRIERTLGAEGDRFKRNDLVNAAGIIYDELGDEEAARAMYLKELPNTRTPYYYMSHLAVIAEKQGKPQEALDWMSKAYAVSEGPVTRLRWGSSFVRGLIRLAPDDAGRIRTAALQVATDASQRDAVRGRSRVYMVQINNALEQWANTSQRRAVAAEVRVHFQVLP
jgi:thioredoxin-related protein